MATTDDGSDPSSHWDFLGSTTDPTGDGMYLFSLTGYVKKHPSYPTILLNDIHILIESAKPLPNLKEGNGVAGVQLKYLVFYFDMPNPKSQFPAELKPVAYESALSAIRFILCREIDEPFGELLDFLRGGVRVQNRMNFFA